MIELLFVIILINFIYSIRCYYAFINPASIFIFGLMCAVLVSIIYKDWWDMDNFHMNTFMIIALGITTFNIVCTITKRKEKFIRLKNGPIKYYSFNKTMLYVVIIFLLFVTVWEYRQKMSITASSNIGEALNLMDQEYKGGDRTLYELPLLLRNLMLLRTCICLYFFYIASRMVALKDYTKDFNLVLIICIIGLIGGIFSGSRGNAVTLILFSFFTWSIFQTVHYSSFRRLSLKRFAIFLMIIIVSLTTFFKATEWVGRSTSGFNAGYYLAVYCGAEIKNLDIYVNENHKSAQFFGQYTLNSLIGDKSQYSIERSLERIQFRENKGHFLGNVYTCFQTYYQDLGYLGVILFVGVMAYIMQHLYYKSMNSRILYRHFDFYLFGFAYLSTTVAYSFFHERFYAAISWYTLKLFIELYLFSLIMSFFVKSSCKSNLSIK